MPKRSSCAFRRAPAASRTDQSNSAVTTDSQPISTILPRFVVFGRAGPLKHRRENTLDTTKGESSGLIL
jgi:hypothetical protein